MRTAREPVWDTRPGDLRRRQGAAFAHIAPRLARRCALLLMCLLLTYDAVSIGVRLRGDQPVSLMLLRLVLSGSLFGEEES